MNETPIPFATGSSNAVLPDATRLGPVRLAVTDLDRSVSFYTGIVGLTVAGRGLEGGHAVAHLSAGAEDIVVLQEEPNSRPAGKHLRHAGLYHVALNYATRLDLSRALRRIAVSGMYMGASNHKTHEAIYISDPDGNGLELAWDAPREQWPRTVEQMMHEGREPLDYDGLLACTASDPVGPPDAGAIRVGHLHFHVGSIAPARSFYVDLLGFELQTDLGTAVFASVAAYHHHVAFNTWRGEGVPPVPQGVVGLREWQLYVPTAADVEAVRTRFTEGGVAVSPAADGAFTTADPWGIPLRVGIGPARH